MKFTIEKKDKEGWIVVAHVGDRHDAVIMGKALASAQKWYFDHIRVCKEGEVIWDE